MKSTENQVKELLTSHEQASESQIKVNESLQFKSGKFQSLGKKFKNEDEQINQSEKNIENLPEKQKGFSFDMVWFYMVSAKAKTKTTIIS